VDIKTLCGKLYNSEIAEEGLLMEFYNICNAAIGNSNGHSHNSDKIIIEANKA
jgi:hypothetical protein